jgi:hypothetical protein
MKYLLFFHSNNGYINTSWYSVIHVFSGLFFTVFAEMCVLLVDFSYGVCKARNFKALKNTEKLF